MMTEEYHDVDPNFKAAARAAVDNANKFVAEDARKIADEEANKILDKFSDTNAQMEADRKAKLELNDLKAASQLNAAADRLANGGQ